MQGEFLSLRRFLVAAAATLALAAAAGCGGGSTTGSSSSSGGGEVSSSGSGEVSSSGGGEVSVETGSLSKPKFIKEANAICKGTREQFSKEFLIFSKQVNEKPPKPTETPPEVTFVETVLVPNYQKQVEEISSLGAPSGDEEAVGAMLNALQAVVDEASEDPQGFVENEGSFGKAPKLAKAYGLEGCAELPG
jgi:hypothetical protein